jgi:hypothetical protein
MKVIAESGDVTKKGLGVILVQVEDDIGFVYELGADFRYRDFNIHSILARGYWEDSTIKISDEELERISKLKILI